MTEMGIATDAAVVAAILTVTQMLKKFVPQIPRRFLPIVPVVLSAVYVCLQYGFEDVNKTITMALAYGLAAAGAFRATKVMTGKDNRAQGPGTAVVEPEDDAGGASDAKPGTPAANTTNNAENAS